MERSSSSLHHRYHPSQQPQDAPNKQHAGSSAPVDWSKAGQSLSSLIQNVKAESTKWIKAQNYSATFAWQEGFGAFFLFKKPCA